MRELRGDEKVPGGDGVDIVSAFLQSLNGRKVRASPLCKLVSGMPCLSIINPRWN
jgi:hypothetical protein